MVILLLGKQGPLGQGQQQAWNPVFLIQKELFKHSQTRSYEDFLSQVE